MVWIKLAFNALTMLLSLKRAIIDFKDKMKSKLYVKKELKKAEKDRLKRWSEIPKSYLKMRRTNTVQLKTAKKANEEVKSINLS